MMQGVSLVYMMQGVSLVSQVQVDFHDCLQASGVAAVETLVQQREAAFCEMLSLVWEVARELVGSAKASPQHF